MLILTLLTTLFLLTSCQSPLQTDDESALPPPPTRTTFEEHHSERDVIPHVYYDQVTGTLLDLAFWLQHKDLPSLTLAINSTDTWEELEISFHSMTLLPITSLLFQEVHEHTGLHQGLIILETRIQNSSPFAFDVDYDNFYLLTTDNLNLTSSKFFIETIQHLPIAETNKDSQLTSGYFIFLLDDFASLTTLKEWRIHLPLVPSETELDSPISLTYEASFSTIGTD
ncbi:hypothetical protein ACWN8P_11765 [Vagococcus salmoninarum]|uniref:Uncharacterized protein n=1 Tax=Vagococcus salmoninarum TaxID=2739 RepID=A0A429ZFB5_9ENTE|nr:hypothetical protein [Vagococcus salmoninarum]RST92403.1 hypothetical protein CBF35_13200 [Vagococcus salmoninarum]